MISNRNKTRQSSLPSWTGTLCTVRFNQPSPTDDGGCTWQPDNPSLTFLFSLPLLLFLSYLVAASILQLKLTIYTHVGGFRISKWSMPSPYCEFPWASEAQVGISGGIIITIYILLLFWFSSLLLSGWLNDRLRSESQKLHKFYLPTIHQRADIVSKRVGG